ncbi:MAG: flavin reductase [Gammaproteobacteria bacterium]|nr:flavin reductase [Gammaproteobacteria bacterium]MBU1724857.1 flavin reductase [Gammaproteobacteria bacterium]MBU2005041.1 flavin reductase [Gammaproteobacteria bacterium]
MKFRRIEPIELKFNFIKSIRYDWMLITSGSIDSSNSMTACWGGVGHLWDIHPVCFIFIRPTRYTYEFIENSDYFSIQFFDENYKDKLRFMGTNSGRNINKISEVDFHQKIDSLGAVYYTEASMVMICKKVYYQDIDPTHFLDKSIYDWYAENYPLDGYHRMYVGSIREILIREDAGYVF